MCLRHLGDDLRIAAALINKYFQKVVADKGNEECVSNAMLSCLTSSNHLQQIVQQDMFQTHLAFFETVQENFRFPQIRKEELQSITMGPYQLRQAKSYASAHKKARMANEDGIEYLCYSCPDDICRYFFDKVIRDKNISEPVLVFTRMASRFKSRKSYDSYILADAAKNGPGAIIGYCCECKHGLRTVGCCSHIATTIFYLCFVRHHGGIRPVAAHVDNFFECDWESSSEEND